MDAHSAVTGALDALYPPTCIVCAQGGEWLCRTCLSRIGLFTRAREQRPPMASVLACGAYADPVLRQLVTSFKYRSASCLVPVWTQVLMAFRASFLDPWPWAGLTELVVTSVPGDADRVRERGMDHAALLADAVRETLVPWARREVLLTRVRSSLRNASLPADVSRAQNVSGVFMALRPVTTSVLLVDDVLTTGATTKEAAQTLLAEGARAVYVVTMAEG